MISTSLKQQKRKLRHHRVRARISGTKVRPRVCVSRSNKHIYAQVINDENAKTILSMDDTRLSEKDKKGKDKTEIAFAVGKALGSLAVKNDIKKVVFDRGGFMYHGRVKALAEGLREAGVKI